ncbi:MAG: hypothetical protein K9M36_01740 [Candidatus Pacebacteria bacterium]|nr:hypothetical protein [Candidatus Paceibacterota bacterium]
MNIKDGTTRQVIFIGPYALKFPRDIFAYIRVRWTYLFEFDETEKSITKNHGKLLLNRIQAGLHSNKTEFNLYKQTPLDFLAPSYIKITNWLVISEKIEGEIVSFDEVMRRLKRVLSEDEMRFAGGDHTVLSKDWIKTNKGIILVDYGGSRKIPQKKVNDHISIPTIGPEIDIPESGYSVVNESIKKYGEKLSKAFTD